MKIEDKFLTIVLASLLIFAGGCSSSKVAESEKPFEKQSKKQDSDPDKAIVHESPKSALLAFYSGIRDNDLGKVTGAATSDRKDIDELLELQIELHQSFIAMQTAGQKKFGPNERMFQLGNPIDVAISQIDRIEFEVDDDTHAHCFIGAKTFFVKDNGSWKVDLNRDPVYVNLAETKKVAYQETADTFSRIAEEIESGKLTTTAEIRAELAVKRAETAQ